MSAASYNRLVELLKQEAEDIVLIDGRVARQPNVKWNIAALYAQEDGTKAPGLAISFKLKFPNSVTPLGRELFTTFMIDTGPVKALAAYDNGSNGEILATRVQTFSALNNYDAKRSMDLLNIDLQNPHVIDFGAVLIPKSKYHLKQNFQYMVLNAFTVALSYLE